MSDQALAVLTEWFDLVEVRLSEVSSLLREIKETLDRILGNNSNVEAH
jgi:hypothetical protein